MEQPPGQATEWNVKSRIRPLLVEKESERQSFFQSGQHPTRWTGLEEQRSGASIYRRTGYPYQPTGVTASFTITMAGKGNTSVANVSAQQQTSEQDSMPRARRVPYGKLRHMTTPAYVTEETITTIIIPPPRNISSTRGNSGSYKSLVSNPAAKPWELSVAKPDDSSPKSKLFVDRQGRQRIKVAEQVSGTSHSAAQERWKRQEIIASEHIQL